jgi:hypothetical protein
VSPFKASLVRTGLGLAAISAAAVALWPVAPSTFNPERAVAFGTALVLWVFAEFFTVGEASTALAEHDSALAKRLYAIANDGAILFLQQHDFGNSWQKGSADPVFDLAHELEKVTSEFENRELQKVNDLVRKAAIALADHLAHAAGPIGAGPLFCIPPDMERASGVLSDRTNADIDKANKLADDLATKLGQLYRQARSKGVNLVPPIT